MVVVRTYTLVFLVLAMMLATHVAYAEDPPIRKPKQAVALEHLAQATKLYNVRSFEKAVEEYKAGALVESAPVFDYNLGQCYRQLHRYDDAIWHYQRFVSESPETPEHVEASQKFIAQMRAELDQKAMTEPPVEDGTAATHHETKAHDTQAPEVTSVRVVPTTLTVDPWYDDGLGWGLAGTGLIAVVVSTGLFLDASSLSDDANHAATQADANSLHDKASTRSLLGAVIGVGGVGLLATGVIKLIIHPTAPSNTTAWNVGVTGNGLAVFGSF